ncbi:MAG TPA: energy-coupling factor transporter transmembrane component T [Pelolinea sp.]|nr:energy-coupling factor transporter transmembrane component T [Pelolinea sp.]
MSDFEYLRRITIGQYLPLGSTIHQIDPRSKLAGFSLIILALTLTSSLLGLVSGLGIVFLLVILSKIPFAYVFRGLLTPLPFLLILAILQIFTQPHSVDSLPILDFQGIMVFPEGIRAGIMLLMKFTSLVFILTVVSATISTLEMIHGLDLLLKPARRIGIKTEAAAMTLQITLRFIPFLAISAERIAKSQVSRGANWGSRKANLITKVRQIIPLLIPLFNGSLKQAESLADAMLARGYAGGELRTGMVEYQFGKNDLIFLLACGIMTLVIWIPLFSI